MKQKIIKKLKKFELYEDTVKWFSKQPDFKTAWNNCKHGDWMLRLLGNLSGEPESEARKKLVLTCCKCARLLLKYIPEGENRPSIAIKTAEKWANHKVDIKKVTKAACEAYATYKACIADYASDYATDYTAAYAADATYAAYAAYAAACVAATGHAGYYAAAAADAGHASKITKLKKCADIVRKYFPEPPNLEGT